MRTPRLLRRFAAARDAVAITEFALSLPLLVALGLTGAEWANYITTKMRVSQLALMIADNGARMHSDDGGASAASESDIQDIFTGAQLQSGNLDLKTNGRVFLSQLEPVASPNTNNRYKISWQRCYGLQTSRASTYGVEDQTNMTGIGPAGRQVTASDYNATMFVEVYYIYKPLFSGRLIPGTAFDEIASMAVRDQRTLGDPIDPSSVGKGTNPC